MDDPSYIANGTLFVWVPVLWWLLNRGAPAKSVAFAIVAAELFLPERVEFKPIALMRFSEMDITYFWVAIWLYTRHRKRVMAARPLKGMGLPILLLVTGAIGTALTNMYWVHFGPRALSPLSYSDIHHAIMADFLGIGVPFVVGATFFRSREALRTLLRVLVILTLAYVPLILIEVRMSPQLHDWIYGYHQHSFGQAKRGGGYRPMVFMEHGLAVAMFTCTGLLATITINRAGASIFPKVRGFQSWFLFALLIACKSSAAAVYAVLLAPFASLASPRKQGLVVLVLGALVLVYPVVRATGMMTGEMLLEATAPLGEERSHSLSFRFLNEDIISERAVEQIWFGWGGHSRMRVFDDRGRAMTTPDGYWIIVFGERGLFGLSAIGMILVLPLLRVRARLKELDPKDQVLLGGISLILALAAIDLLPNGLFTTLPYLYAGVITAWLRRTPVPTSAKSP